MLRTKDRRVLGWFRVVCKERLPKNEHPAPHIARLVADVEAGRFDTGQLRY